MEQIRALNRDTETKAGALSFTRWAMALAEAHGQPDAAAKAFATRWPRSIHVSAVQKAAVTPGGTGTWGAPLVELAPLASGFVAFLAPLVGWQGFA